MNLYVTRESLLDAISHVVGAVEKRSTLPILENLKLEVKDGVLSVTGSDLEVQMTSTLDVEGEPGAITVPAYKLFSICKALPDGAQVRLSTDGSYVILVAGKSQFKLASLPAADYPLLKAEGLDGTFTVETQTMADLLSSISYAMAKSDVRYYLNGAYFEVADGSINIVATDGHRLAVKKGNITSGDFSGNFIVPHKGVLELQKILRDAPEMIAVHFVKNYIQVEAGRTFVSIKLIDGTFPNYRAIIPSDSQDEMVADSGELISAVRRVALLSTDIMKQVVFNLDGDKLTLESSNSDVGESSDVLDVQSSVKDGRMAYRFDLLLEAIIHQGGEKVRFSWAEKNGSAVITSCDDDGGLHLVAPLRL